MTTQNKVDQYHIEKVDKDSVLDLIRRFTKRLKDDIETDVRLGLSNELQLDIRNLAVWIELQKVVYAHYDNLKKETSNDQPQ